MSQRAQSLIISTDQRFWTERSPFSFWWAGHLRGKLKMRPLTSSLVNHWEIVFYLSSLSLEKISGRKVWKIMVTKSLFFYDYDFIKSFISNFVMSFSLSIFFRRWGRLVKWSYKAWVKEAIHIRLYPNNINRDSVIEIPEVWMSTIRKYNHRRAVHSGPPREQITEWTARIKIYQLELLKKQLITAEHHAL